MGVLLNFIFVVILIFSFGCKSESRETKSYSLEYKIASLNAGGYISDNDPSINRFRSLLNQLSQKYIENKQQIADMSVTTQNMLKKDNISESLLNIMVGMNSLFDSKVSNQKFAEYAAAYATLRSERQTHIEAISGLKATLQSMGVY